MKRYALQHGLKAHEEKHLAALDKILGITGRDFAVSDEPFAAWTDEPDESPSPPIRVTRKVRAPGVTRTPGTQFRKPLARLCLKIAPYHSMTL